MVLGNAEKSAAAIFEISAGMFRDLLISTFSGFIMLDIRCGD
jgi:hypothetical protein